MPRLLILCEYPTLLGGERSMLAALPAVMAAGFEVHVAAPAKGTISPVVSPLAEAVQRQSASLTAWRTHDEAGRRLPLDRLRSDLVAFLGQIRPDLVHANSLSMSRIAGPVTADCRIASLGHLRDIVTLSDRAVDDVNANRRLVAVSRATRDFHVDQGIDSRRCVVVHNGVDLSKFLPRRPTGYLHKKLDLPPSSQLIATIGQLGQRKGTDVVLLAALQITAQAPDVHWLIVGERTSTKREAADFEFKIREMLQAYPSLNSRVHFLGTRNDVPELLNECVLLVHGARQEPLGRVLLEAAAAGTAVVATEVGGTAEIFPTELDGALLVPPNNPSAIAEAVLNLLRNETRRQSMGHAGRQRAEATFDIRQAATRLIEHYWAVLNE